MGNFTKCDWCQKEIVGTYYYIHIAPRTIGGLWRETNSIEVCLSCLSSKSLKEAAVWSDMVGSKGSGVSISPEKSSTPPVSPKDTLLAKIRMYIEKLIHAILGGQ